MSALRPSPTSAFQAIIGPITPVNARPATDAARTPNATVTPMRQARALRWTARVYAAMPSIGPPVGAGARRYANATVTAPTNTSVG
ncbi:MAG: hypothetical protein K0S70_2531 [Microbacterium sp.]|nr:hypothetical protein [Microbacterium sp.]